jgi:hypothetical protein
MTALLFCIIIIIIIIAFAFIIIDALLQKFNRVGGIIPRYLQIRSVPAHDFSENLDSATKRDWD